MTIPAIEPYAMPTELPQNRASWKPSARRSALLIHDMQRYFTGFFPGGASPMKELVANIVRLRHACEELDIPVFYSVQNGAQSPTERGLLEDFWGKGMGGDPEITSIVAELAPAAHHVIIKKRRYSAFHGTPFLEALRSRGRDQLFICGVYAHIGCLATALDAFMNDVQPFMVADALGDFSPEEHRMALGYAARRCASVGATRDLTAALVK